VFCWQELYQRFGSDIRYYMHKNIVLSGPDDQLMNLPVTTYWGNIEDGHRAFIGPNWKSFCDVYNLRLGMKLDFTFNNIKTSNVATVTIMSS